MLNKNYLMIGIIVGVIVILIGGFLIFSGDDSEEQGDGSQEIQEELSDNLMPVSKEEYQEAIQNISFGTIRDYVSNLDKSGCLELETKKLQDECIVAIDLTQKALASNDYRMCNDDSYQVKEYLRVDCIKKVIGANQ